MLACLINTLIQKGVLSKPEIVGVLTQAMDDVRTGNDEVSHTVIRQLIDDVLDPDRALGKLIEVLSQDEA